MQVFDDKEDGLSFGLFQKDSEDGFERFLSLTLW